MFCKITKKLVTKGFKNIPALKTSLSEVLCAYKLTMFWCVEPYSVKPEGNKFSRKMGLDT